MDCFQTIEKITGIISSVITCFGVVAGVYIASDYTSKLKERQHEAIFNFYSRFHMYLLEFKNRMRSPDQCMLLLKYNKYCLKNIFGITIPDNDEINNFNKFIEVFISFLKNTDNQIPLSKLILSSKYQLERTLISLTNLGNDTPYNEYMNNEPVRNEHNKILENINILLVEIEKKQTIISIKIGKKESKKQCLQVK